MKTTFRNSAIRNSAVRNSGGLLRNSESAFRNSAIRNSVIRNSVIRNSGGIPNWHQAVKLHFFGPNSIFDVPDRFNRSISRSLVNLKKIGQGHIFALSRDQVTESRISHFQNMLRSSQCAPLLFGIDACRGPIQVQTRLILICAEKFPLDKWGNLTYEYIGRKN